MLVDSADGEHLGIRKRHQRESVPDQPPHTPIPKPTHKFLDHVAKQFPDMDRFHGVMDNLNTHWSPDLSRTAAQVSHVPFHPKSVKTGV